MTAEEIREQLDACAVPGRGEGAKRYFKEPIDPRGVAAGELKRIAAEVYREIKAWPVGQRNRLCTELWEGGKFEDGLLVCYVYRRFEKQCGVAEFKVFESWINKYVSNWAHNDSLAPVVCACIGKEPALMQQLTDWTRAKNRWKRRAAATSLLKEAKHGRSTEFIFDIAGRMIQDPDEMVQKGVGWLLKETYPKRPAETLEFLMERIETTPRLIVRYAAEKMPEADRALVMKRR